MLDLTALILLALSVLSPPPQRTLTTRATRYADTARDEGGTPRCVHELPPDVYRALHPLRVAHRTLPCGTLLIVEAGGRRTLAAVLDRGPWNRLPALGEAVAAPAAPSSALRAGGPWGAAGAPGAGLRGADALPGLPAPQAPSWAAQGPQRAGAGVMADARAGARSVSQPGAARPYRGDLDVSPVPADALGLTLRVGRLRVRYWPLPWQPFAVRRRAQSRVPRS